MTRPSRRRAAALVSVSTSAGLVFGVLVALPVVTATPAQASSENTRFGPEAFGILSGPFASEVDTSMSGGVVVYSSAAYSPGVWTITNDDPSGANMGFGANLNNADFGKMATSVRMDVDYQGNPPDDALRGSDPTISGNGRYVAFTSKAPLGNGDQPIPDVAGGDVTNPDRLVPRVYLRDRETGLIAAINPPSVGGAVVAPDGRSEQPRLDATGTRLVFTTTATNFTPNPFGDPPSHANYPHIVYANLDPNGDGVVDVDPATGRLVDPQYQVVTPTTQWSGFSDKPSISLDGSTVAYLNATDISLPRWVGYVAHVGADGKLVATTPGGTEIIVEYAFGSGMADSTLNSWADFSASSRVSLSADGSVRAAATSQVSGQGLVGIPWTGPLDMTGSEEAPLCLRTSGIKIIVFDARALGDTDAESITESSPRPFWGAITGLATGPGADGIQPALLADGSQITYSNGVDEGPSGLRSLVRRSTPNWGGCGTAPAEEEPLVDWGTDSATTFFGQTVQSAGGALTYTPTEDGLLFRWNPDHSVITAQAAASSDQLVSGFDPNLVNLTAVKGLTSLLVSAPMNSTPMNSTPMNSTPISLLPMNSTPMNSTPLSELPMNSTPMNSTPMNSTPMNSTPMNSTPMNSTPLADMATVRVPMNSTPMNSTPMNSTPMNSTPMNSTPMNSTPLAGLPMNSTPMNSTPMNSTPMNSTPMNSTPMNSTPMNSTPLVELPMNSTPMNSTPMNSTPMNSTPVEGQPMNSTPMNSTPMNSTPMYLLPMNSTPLVLPDLDLADDATVDDWWAALLGLTPVVIDGVEITLDSLDEVGIGDLLTWARTAGNTDTVAAQAFELLASDLAWQEIVASSLGVAFSELTWGDVLAWAADPGNADDIVAQTILQLSPPLTSWQQVLDLIPEFAGREPSIATVMAWANASTRTDDPIARTIRQFAPQLTTWEQLLDRVPQFEGADLTELTLSEVLDWATADAQEDDPVAQTILLLAGPIASWDQLLDRIPFFQDPVTHHVILGNWTLNQVLTWALDNTDNADALQAALARTIVQLLPPITSWEQFLRWVPDFAGEDLEDVTFGDILDWAEEHPAHPAAQAIATIAGPITSWEDLLAFIPEFADTPITGVTLGQVLDWAQANPELPAAKMILSLSWFDLNYHGTDLAKLALGSILFAAQPLSDIDAPGKADGDSNLDRWRELLDAAGYPEVSLAATTSVIDLDVAQVKLSTIGLDQVPLGALDPQKSALRYVSAAGLHLDGGRPLGALVVNDSGTTLLQVQQANGGHGLDSSTGLDLVEDYPVVAAATAGDLLLAMLDARDIPWDELDLSQIPADALGGGDDGTDLDDLVLRFSFDQANLTPHQATTISVALSPGQRITASQLTATGAGTVLATDDSGRRTLPMSWSQQGDRAVFSFGSVQPGTYAELRLEWTGSIQADPLSSREISFFDGFDSYAPTLSSYDPNRPAVYPDSDYSGDPEHPYSVITLSRGDAGRIRFGGLSPFQGAGTLVSAPDAPASEYLADNGKKDIDFFEVPAPATGERLVVTTGVGAGDLDLSMLTATSANLDDLTSLPLSDKPVGGLELPEETADAADPGTAQTIVDADVNPAAELEAEAGSYTVVDAAAHSGEQGEIVSAGVDEVGSASTVLIRLESPTGASSLHPYTFRFEYLSDRPEQNCTVPESFTGVQSTPADQVAKPAGLNTLFVVDAKQLGDLYGPTAAAETIAKLTEVNSVAGVDAAVLRIDAVEAVQNARVAYDQNPCGYTERTRLVAAVNAAINGYVGAAREGLSSLVIVGGDDVIPFAPVAQRTQRFGEAANESALRLRHTRSGADCPVIDEGDADPCATPLSAMAAGDYILTDDPYGDLDPRTVIGGTVYAADVAMGRLVETPAQIQQAVDNFVAADGELAADQLLTASYPAWADLPAAVTDNLEWRDSDPVALGTLNPDDPSAAYWNRQDLLDQLLPEGGTPRPTIVSLTVHADETRMLPGVRGAEGGADLPAVGLFNTGQLTGSVEQLTGTVLFTLGCHAGNNLPATYYPVGSGVTTLDWAEVLGGVGAFVGNTGFGLSDDKATALSERIMERYSAWLGVEDGGQVVTTGMALRYAKQQYLADFGHYTGYDDKVLMEATYYGLPMYTLAGPTKEAPLPVASGFSGDVTSASLTFTPDFSTQSADDGTEYLIADDGAELTADHPVLPVVRKTLPDKPGYTAHGVLITTLESDFAGPDTPTLGTGTTGVAEDPDRFDQISFPQSFARVTSLDTPAGPRQQVVVTPARVVAESSGEATVGVTERLTEMGIRVLYSTDAGDDWTPPVIGTTGTGFDETTGIASFEITAEDETSSPSQAVLLVQAAGANRWTPTTLTVASTYERQGAHGVVFAPVNLSGLASGYRWFVQVADQAGNVAVSTQGGRLTSYATPAPSFDLPDEVTITSGERLTLVVDLHGTVALADGAGLSATLNLRRPGADPAAGLVDDRQPVLVRSVVDGDTVKYQVLIDLPQPPAGTYPATLQVCTRSGSCSSETGFQLVVLPNQLPTATVQLNLSYAQAGVPLVATASGSDPDGDALTFKYAWYVGGKLHHEEVLAALQSIWTPAAEDLGPGVVVTVYATPFDGKAPGAPAQASTQARPNSAPSISLTLTNSAGDPTDPVRTVPGNLLTADPHATDGELDTVTVTYTWLVDGVIAQGPDARNTFQVPDLPAGTVITVRATPFDGTEYGTTREKTAVLNAAPQITGLEIVNETDRAASHPLPGHELRAQFTATDPDSSDEPATDIEWTTSDGATGTGETFVVPAAATPNSTVQLTVSASDGLSSVQSTVNATIWLPAPTGLWVRQVATLQGGFGWPYPYPWLYSPGTWTNANVLVQSICGAPSGVTVSCTASQVINHETPPEGQTVTSTATVAGRVPVTTSLVVRIDKTAPVLAPTWTGGGAVSYGSVVTVTPHATDGLSGVSSQFCQQPNTWVLPSTSVLCTAYDYAGNQTSTVVTIPVQLPNVATCFGAPSRQVLPPLAADGSTKVSSASSVAVRFRVCGPNGSSLGQFDLIRSVTPTGPNAARAPAVRFLWDPYNQWWQAIVLTGWETADTEYDYRVTLADGTTVNVGFIVKKAVVPTPLSPPGYPGTPGFPGIPLPGPPGGGFWGW